MQWVVWIEQHKDFCLALGALLAPFAAVAIGLFAATMQSRALLRATERQIRASGLREYRQNLLEKLRDELAAQVASVKFLRDAFEEQGKSPEVSQLDKEMAARSVRIRLLSSTSGAALDDYLTVQNKVIDELQAHKDRQWSTEAKREYRDLVNAFGDASMTLLHDQMERASD